jgi:hypothetical protein
MAETHAISALRAKRAEVSGCIHDLEKKVKRMRANLAHIDATIRVFAPDLNPKASRPSGAIGVPVTSPMLNWPGDA